MTGFDMYTIAGQASGTCGNSGNGGLANGGEVVLPGRLLRRVGLRSPRPRCGRSCTPRASIQRPAGPGRRGGSSWPPRHTRSSPVTRNRRSGRIWEMPVKPSAQPTLVRTQHLPPRKTPVHRSLVAESSPGSGRFGIQCLIYRRRCSFAQVSGPAMPEPQAAEVVLGE